MIFLPLQGNQIARSTIRDALRASDFFLCLFPAMSSPFLCQLAPHFMRVSYVHSPALYAG